MALGTCSQSCSDSRTIQEDELEHSSRAVKSLNECYFAIKGSNTINRLGNMSTELSSSQTSIGSDIALHLQSMFCLLRQEETLKMAVKLESLRAGRTRYLVVVSRPGNKKISTSNIQQPQKKMVLSSSSTTSHSNTDNIYHQCSTESCDIKKPICSGNDKNTVEECSLLGIDCNETSTTVGLVLKVLADTSIRLDGDGGFSVKVCGNQHIFKPVSVQAMWSALQTLHKVSSKAREHNFFAGGNSHEWVQYYEQRIESERSCLNEWHAMDSLESRRPPSPDTVRNRPTERVDTETVIRTALKEIMISVDLDEVTSKYIRVRLEEHLDMDLIEFKSFIDQEMLVILGQMDAPTEIFDHVYLGSEWNASNLEELQRNGVHHILNVTREIDNFFPGLFDYFNVRVYDDEKTDLLKHWDNTYKYISRAKTQGSKVLVHCKMGISRSASVVIAYAMKAHNWNFDQALKHVKDKRSCIKPNKSFLTQLETYQGILAAMKNKGKIIDKLQRSKSETNLRLNNHTKEGKMLAGSEPTPLIQALQSRTYPSTKKEIQFKWGKHYKHSKGPRPNSWSYFKEEKSSLSSKLSASLENLVLFTDNNSRETVACNVRVPCKNGQHHYSITQNKILYLEENVDFEKNDEIHALHFFKHSLDKKTTQKSPFNILQRQCVDNFSNVKESSPDSTRWKSEELIAVNPSKLATYLSVSAPHSFCIKTLGTPFKTDPSREDLTYNQGVFESRNLTRKSEILGKVKNLKMSFEAKTKSADCSTDKKKNCTSLPSSPISIHVDVKSNKVSNTLEHDDSNNVKVMVGKFEITKMRQQKPSLGFRHLQRPKSLYSPIASQSPILFIPPLGSTTTTGSTMFRKMQQHGRTHPLTIINKPRFNPSTAYNTM